MEQMTRDVRLAGRGLLRNPGFFAVAIMSPTVKGNLKLWLSMEHQSPSDSAIDNLHDYFVDILQCYVVVYLHNEF